MYALPIWGEEGLGKIIDRLRARFGKYWLKVPYTTSNDAVRKEFGAESGTGLVLKRIIKYYHYIGSKPNEELIKICMNYYKQKIDKRINIKEKTVFLGL